MTSFIFVLQLPLRVCHWVGGEKMRESLFNLIHSCYCLPLAISAWISFWTERMHFVPNFWMFPNLQACKCDRPTLNIICLAGSAISLHFSCSSLVPHVLLIECYFFFSNLHSFDQKSQCKSIPILLWIWPYAFLNVLVLPYYCSLRLPYFWLCCWK